jgi:hypothetical protein
MTTPLPPIDDVGVHATSATNPARSQCARIGIRPRSATECGDSAAVTASRSSMTEAYTAAKAFKRFRTRGLSIQQQNLDLPEDPGQENTQAQPQR